MRRGTRVVAGRERNHARKGNDRRPMQHVGGGRQAWPHEIVGNPPAGTHIAMSVRGGARGSTHPIYHPPPVAALTRYAPAVTNAPARNPAVMREHGAVRHPGNHMYPRMTPAVYGDGFNGSAKEAALEALLVDIREKARRENGFSRKRVAEMQAEVLAYRQRAEHAERELELVRDALTQEQVASNALTLIVREKTELLADEKERTKTLKSLTDSLLQEKVDLNKWDDEPTRGHEALALLYPDGIAVGLPRQAEMQDRCSPGQLRQIYLEKKKNDCACRREFAANGLTNPQQRFADIAMLGEGGFGTVHRGRCRKTKKNYAIKTIKPGNDATVLRRELLAYVMMGTHANIIGVDCLSDVVGSEGLIMEMAVCDMFKASTGKSEPVFTLAQQLNLQADATQGFKYMHDKGVIHCDVKLENTLICRCDGPTGFVAKVTDPGLWCGLGETRRARTGTLGWTPLENVLGDVEAAPHQDSFAVGVDLCFILAHPTWKTEVVAMWSHSELMTVGEKERLQVVRAEGGDEHQLREEVTVRTMSDGSLPRMFLRPGNFNSTLPPSEVLKVCEVLAKTVSRHPMDRPKMTELTAFLRDLASKTAENQNTLAAIPLGFGLPPGLAPLPGLRLPPGLAAEPALGVPPGLAPPPGVAPLPAMGVPAGFDLPHGFDLPAAAMPVVVGGGDGAEGVLPLADGTRGGSATVVHASGLPAAGLVGTNGGRDGNAPEGFALAGRLSHLPLEGRQPVAQRMPSMERVHLAPPLLVGPHAGGEGVSAGAGLSPAEAVVAPRGSSPIGSALHAEGSIDGAVVPSLEEVAGWVDPFPPPLPGSAAQAMFANRLSDALRPLGGNVRLASVPPPVASWPLAGQAYRGGIGSGGGGSSASGSGSGGGGGGDSSGSGGGGGGGGSGGGERFGGGRTQDEVEVEVHVVDDPDTPLTFAQVLARGFGTSAPADYVYMPPPGAAPRPRVAGGPDTPPTFVQVLARGFSMSISAADGTTPPPAAAPHPRVVGGPDTPLTFAQVLARGFGASVHAADAATPSTAPPAELSWSS